MPTSNLAPLLLPGIWWWVLEGRFLSGQGVSPVSPHEGHRANREAVRLFLESPLGQDWKQKQRWPWALYLPLQQSQWAPIQSPLSRFSSTLENVWWRRSQPWERKLSLLWWKIFCFCEQAIKCVHTWDYMLCMCIFKYVNRCVYK